MNRILIYSGILAVLSIVYFSGYFVKSFQSNVNQHINSYTYKPFNKNSKQKEMTISKESPRYKPNKQVQVLEKIKTKLVKESKKPKTKLNIKKPTTPKPEKLENNASNPLYSLLYDEDDVDTVLENREDIIALINSERNRVKQNDPGAINR